MPTFKVYTRVVEYREIEANSEDEAIALSGDEKHQPYKTVVEKRWAVEEAIFSDFAPHV